MNLQEIAEAYSQVHEKKDSSYLETDMKKRQANNEKAIKDMEKVKGQKNPHFEEAGADEKSMKKFQELQKNVDQKKKNIRGNDSAEQKARLEKKRGMKLDDHPQFKKESVSGIAAAYQAVYEGEGMHKDAKTGEVVDKAEVGKTYYPNMPKKKSSVALRKEKEMKKEEVEAVDEGLTGARADRARQMQDSETKSKGGKRTPADRDTAFRLGTGTAEKGTRKTGGRGGDEYGDRGKGNAAKRRMTMEELEGNPVYEATKTDIKEFVGAMLGNAAKGVAKNVAMGAVNSAGKALATPTGAAIAGGTLGAATGGKKKVKKSLATGAGAAAGAALGGLPGAVIGGIAGNKLS